MITTNKRSNSERPAKNMPFWMLALKGLHILDKEVFYDLATQTPFGPYQRKYNEGTIKSWIYGYNKPPIAFSEWANTYFRDLEEKKQLLTA